MDLLVKLLLISILLSLSYITYRNFSNPFVRNPISLFGLFIGIVQILNLIYANTLFTSNASFLSLFVLCCSYTLILVGFKFIRLYRFLPLRFAAPPAVYLNSLSIYIPKPLVQLCTQLENLPSTSILLNVYALCITLKIFYFAYLLNGFSFDMGIIFRNVYLDQNNPLDVPNPFHLWSILSLSIGILIPLLLVIVPIQSFSGHSSNPNYKTLFYWTLLNFLNDFSYGNSYIMFLQIQSIILALLLFKRPNPLTADNHFPQSFLLPFLKLYRKISFLILLLASVFSLLLLRSIRNKASIIHTLSSSLSDLAYYYVGNLSTFDLFVQNSLVASPSPLLSDTCFYAFTAPLYKIISHLSGTQPITYPFSFVIDNIAPFNTTIGLSFFICAFGIFPALALMPFIGYIFYHFTTFNNSHPTLNQSMRLLFLTETLFFTLRTWTLNGLGVWIFVIYLFLLLPLFSYIRKSAQ